MNEIINSTVGSLMDISGLNEGEIMVRYGCEWKHVCVIFPTYIKLWWEFHFFSLGPMCPDLKRERKQFEIPFK